MRIKDTVLSVVVLAFIMSAFPVLSLQAQETPEEDKSNRIIIAPQVEIYFPTNGKTRDRFGDSWVTYGVTFLRRGEDFGASRRAIRFNILYKDEGDNRAFLLPVQYAVVRPLSESDSTRTYAGFGAGPVFADFRSVQDDIDTNLKVGAVASVFAGAKLGRNLAIQADYNLMSRIEGFNFSGFKLSAILLY